MKKGFSAIEVLVVLVVLAILAAGVWVWRNSIAPTNPPLTPTVTVTSGLIPSPTESTSPTPSTSPEVTKAIITSPALPSNWQTYKNEKYAYEIKHPPEGIERLIKTSDHWFDSFSVEFRKVGVLPPGPPHIFRIEVQDNPKGLSRRYFLAERLSGSPETVLENVKIDEVAISGVSALRIILDGGWWQGSGPHTVYMIPKGLKMYLIWNDQYYGGRHEPGGVFELNKGAYFDEMELILSTFKFLD